MSADAMQVYDGPADPHRRGERRASSARLEHRLLGFVPIDRDLLRRRLRPARARGDRRAARRRAGARSSSAAPACTCARRWPSSTSARPSTRDPGALGRATRGRSSELHAALPEAVAAGIEPTDRQRVLRAHELLEAGHEPPPPAHAPSRAVDRAHAPSDAARRADDGPRGARRAHRRPHRRDARGRRPRGGAERRTQPARRPTARKRARLPGAARRRHRGDANEDPPLRQAPAHLAAQAPERAPRST